MNNLAMTITLTSVLSLLFLSYAAFAYRYFRYSPWNATWQGITLESQKITMAALVGFFIVDTLAPSSYPGRYSILVILLTLLLIESIATLAGLLHVQRHQGAVSPRQGVGYTDPENISDDASATLEDSGKDKHD